MKFEEMDATLIFDRDKMLLYDPNSRVEATVCHGYRLVILMDGVFVGTCYGQFFCYLGTRKAEVHLKEDGEIRLEVENVRET